MKRLYIAVVIASRITSDGGSQNEIHSYIQLGESAEEIRGLALAWIAGAYPNWNYRIGPVEPIDEEKIRIAAEELKKGK